MKNLLSFLLIFLLVMPPVWAHTDVIVKSKTEEIVSLVLVSHNPLQHKNSSEQKKDTNHHHCTMINFSDVFIKDEFVFQFYQFCVPQKNSFYYKQLKTSSFLENPFQPPKQY